jgi:Flp pilus assembly protein CpaB
MRAFALPEQDVSFDGLLRPGDRVDVLFVAANPADRVEVLVANALVLTVGRDLGQERAEPSAVRRGRVTLSLAPEQAAAVARREGAGRIRLALRNPQDALVSSPMTDSRASSAANMGGEDAR